MAQNLLGPVCPVPLTVRGTLLTEQQGEALDQIEYQVRAAGEYVESGNADIRFAIKYQTQLRRRKCCCCVLILVLVGVILLGLFITNPALLKKIK